MFFFRFVSNYLVTVDRYLMQLWDLERALNDPDASGKDLLIAHYNLNKYDGVILNAYNF